MLIKHQIDNVFIGICKQILSKNLSIQAWSFIESCDEFQTENYCGGFDATENQFTFSYFNEKKEEFWFQLSLDEITQIVSGRKKEIQLRLAEN